jgi:formylglycine-generating enzyme required for sulfatase activity
MFSATFCCSRCRKEYYSTRPIRRNLRKALATFYLVIIILVLLNAYTSKKKTEQSVIPVATQKTETSLEKADQAVSPVAAPKTETSQEKTEKPAPPVVAEKASAITIVQAPQLATLPSLLPIEKSSDKIPVQAAQDKSQASPSKPEVSLSLNDAMSAQEQVIQQKVTHVLDLLRQLKQHLESDEAGFKDEIRNRLKAISEAAAGGVSQLKASSELSKLRAVLVRLEEQSRQNMRLSATARAKTQELLLIKRQELERIETLSADSIKKLVGYEDSCGGWLSDFDTLWKIDGLQPASKQLLDDLSKLQEMKTITSPKPLVAIPKAVAVEEPSNENDFRIWTNIYGMVEKGRILSVDQINVFLEREDGSTVQMPLTLLFPDDQLLVSKFKSLSPSFSQSPEKKQALQKGMFTAQKTPDGYLNVRSGPGLRNSVVGRIPSGAMNIMQEGATIEDTKDQIIWMPVKYGKVRGYVSSGFLKLSAEKPIAQPSLIQSFPAEDYTNGLGMKFVAVPGTQVMMCIHETRNADYKAYMSAQGRINMRWGSSAEAGTWQSRAGTGKEQHPVVYVFYEDAVSFCRWLSNKDGKTYRLPTDAEWSAAVGLRAEIGKTPEEKSQNGPADVFPWGGSFPPFRSGNYARALAEDGLTILEDGFQDSAPVMSFSANNLGIYDLGGNVWEWCQDWYNDNQAFRVERGASFSIHQRDFLRSAHRGYAAPSYRSDILGFRVVLELPGG